MPCSLALSESFLWKRFYCGLFDLLEDAAEEYGEIFFDATRGELSAEFSMRLCVSSGDYVGVAHVFGPVGSYLGDVPVILSKSEDYKAYLTQLKKKFSASFKEKIGWSPVWRESEE